MRRTPQSLRRHLLLLLLTLLLTPLIPTLTVADSGDDAPLGPTQIAGDLPPPETDGTAVIQWGGGSLHQLTARLAVNGCDLNLLWIYDDQTQKYTAPYTFDGPSFLNAPFERLYGQNIPTTTLWVKCIDMIQHVYGYWLLSDWLQAWVDRQAKGTPFDISQVVDPLTDCGDHWSHEVIDEVFPSLPHNQRLCVIRFEKAGLVYDQPWTSRSTSGLTQVAPTDDMIVAFAYFGSVPTVLLSSDATIPSDWRLQTELHELCHAHEHWHAVKHILRYEYFAEQVPSNTLLAYLTGSPYMEDFIQAVGFEEQEDGSWALNDESAHSHSYGSTSPVELSAEVCAGYMVTKLAVSERVVKHYEPLLTEAVIAWLEQYIFVLPESRIEVLDPNEEGPAPQVEVAEASAHDTEPQVELAEVGGVLLSGLVLNSEGQPEPRVNVKACAQHLCHYATTDANGVFSRQLEEGEYWLGVEAPDEDGVHALVGYYAADAPGNLTTDRNAATVINLTDDITGIEITLP